MKFVEGDDANNAPGPEFESGQTVEFSYKVTNTGDTALNNVKVTDDTLGDITCPANQLDIGESFTCTISKQLAEGPAAVFMEAEATATSPQGDDVSDTDPINLSISAMPPPPPTNCGVLPWTMDLRIYGSDAERHALYAPGEETPFLIVTRNPDWFPSTDRWGSKYYFYQTPGIPTGLLDDLEVAALGEPSGTTGDFKTSKRIRCFRVNTKSPIALDVDGSGAIERVDAVVEFDFAGDRNPETVSQWFAPTEGILFDASIPGPLTGAHLFGDQAGIYADGFEKLALLDTNGDGQVAGLELSGLGIWTDLNTNGVLDSGEQSTLASHGVVSLSTAHTNMVSAATLADGTKMMTEDLWFPVAPAGSSNRTAVLAGLGLICLLGLVARRGRKQDLDTELQLLTGDKVRM